MFALYATDNCFELYINEKSSLQGALFICSGFLPDEESHSKRGTR